ncbi:MAG: hypothetical protein ACTHO8_09540 [Solirubrobacterales bacterium]
MAVAHKIAAFDIVELTERVDDAPAGARGGVLELREGEMAMIEVTKPDLGPAARIVFAPFSKVRVVEAAPRR